MEVAHTTIPRYTIIMKEAIRRRDPSSIKIDAPNKLGAFFSQKLMGSNMKPYKSIGSLRRSATN